MTWSIHWYRHLPITNNYFFGDDVHAAEQHRLRRHLWHGPLRERPYQPASDRRPARYPSSTRNRTSGSRFGRLAWSCSVQTGHYGHKKGQRMSYSMLSCNFFTESWLPGKRPDPDLGGRARLTESDTAGQPSQARGSLQRENVEIHLMRKHVTPFTCSDDHAGRRPLTQASRPEGRLAVGPELRPRRISFRLKPSRQSHGVFSRNPPLPMAHRQMGFLSPDCQQPDP
jgi:hypothetical protein